MKKYYCGQCDDDMESHIETRSIMLPVKGDPTTVTAELRVCDTCGELCFDEVLEEKLFETAYNKYRRKHGVIFPEEIQKLREEYGLSQRSLAALLGWGEVTIHRYEGGSLPDEAHNQLLDLLRYPENMYRIAQRNADRIPASARKKLFARLEKMLGTSPCVMEAKSEIKETAVHSRKSVSAVRKGNPGKKRVAKVK